MFRPWLFVIFAFLLLLAAWSSLFIVAARVSPQQIIVEKSH